ncbi:MAG: hypothetical protein NTV20_01260, partial [Candidatus Shapirobacteria bacterium]|nr:hypothetical protein [Candidatus Shapirobacteria bacterium]
NDYFLHGLNTDYFSKLIDFYLQPGKGDFGQITIGLENDYLWSAYGQEYANQLKVIKEKGIKTITMSEFSQWYQKHFPKLSPVVEITGEDILGSGKKSTWLMSILGRINFLEENRQKTIRDLRNYNEEFAEPYLQVANQNHQLKINLSAQIDTVRFPEQGQKLETNPEKLIQKKVDLPFQTPKIIFFLMAIIFIGFLIISWCLNKWFFGLMFFGIIVQSLTMIKSGLLSSFGMSFWGANGHDGIWHIALINELTRNFPPQNMVFAHFNLSNYHWFFNLTIAFFHKITFLPVLNLYFQIIPIVFAALLGILTFVLVKKISKNNLSSLLAVFFAFFGGSFGWLVTLFRHQGIGGESLFWANQSISILINPPFAFSLLLILWGLIVLYQYLENFNHKKSWIRKIYLGLIFGLIIGFKAYGGLIVLAGLAFAAFWELVFEKKTKTLIIFLIALAISLIIFLPNNKGASSLFVWSPLWFPRTMLTFTDRLGWLRLSDARQVYATTHQWLKWFLAEGLALFIFLIGNLGSRFIGSFKLLSWLKNFRKINSWERMFLGCLLASLIAPLLFIQKGNPWNSLQFFYYFLFFSGLLTSFYLGEFLNKKTNWLKIIIILVVAGLTLPTTWGALKHYLPSRAPAKISFSELEGLDFLRKQPRGIVLTYPHDYQLREKAEAPKPLYIYETTAYVSAFTNKQTFLEDEM